MDAMHQLSSELEGQIDAHFHQICEALATGAKAALARVNAEAEEAMQRIRDAAPVIFDYDGAAAYLGMPRRTLERRVSERGIEFRRDGRSVTFTKTALDEYQKRGTEVPRPVKPFTL